MLCEERNAAASSRVVTRQSRAARIGDGLAERGLRLDRGRAMSPRPRHDTARMANAACFAAASGAQSRENEASCAGTRPAAVYVYSKRSRYAQIARCRGRATLRRNMPHVGKQGKSTAQKCTQWYHIRTRPRREQVVPDKRCQSTQWNRFYALGAPNLLHPMERH